MMMLFTSTVIPSFLRKKKSLIAYLSSGYVFGAFYRQISFSKTAHQDQTYHQQCLSFLVAGKCVGETISLPEHRNVNVLNQGGLWKMKMLFLFLVLLKLISCH